MIAVIVAHGDLIVTPEVEALVRRAGLLIAADGGAAAALSQGWWPHVLVGDLDSAPPEVRAQVEAHGAEVRQYPPRKDETDTELALRLALARGAEDIYLLGALGDRTDHTLANLLLLALPELAGVRVTIVAGRQRICAVRGQAEIAGHVGDVVSLLPIGGDAAGIWTTGLEYPLQGGTLYLGAPRGISNILTAPVATVRVERGLLLAVVTHG
ncbi:MAG TPA: thiamine diphosphokinase [Anaerolineae bacterium]|nr:thiamine diphosphokinase [Anaerolineae bacterium]HOR00566.1 thiamine diphosphokinase [Anaerolineae bacterium]HPL28997.1 thiamine diphosphokinase [Anaerolineae bacterium]